MTEQQIRQRIAELAAMLAALKQLSDAIAAQKETRH